MTTMAKRRARSLTVLVPGEIHSAIALAPSPSPCRRSPLGKEIGALNGINVHPVPTAFPDTLPGPSGSHSNAQGFNITDDMMKNVFAFNTPREGPTSSIATPPHPFQLQHPVQGETPRDSRIDPHISVLPPLISLPRCDPGESVAGLRPLEPAVQLHTPQPCADGPMEPSATSASYALHLARSTPRADIPPSALDPRLPSGKLPPPQKPELCSPQTHLMSMNFQGKDPPLPVGPANLHNENNATQLLETVSRESESRAADLIRSPPVHNLGKRTGNPVVASVRAPTPKQMRMSPVTPVTLPETTTCSPSGSSSSSPESPNNTPGPKPILELPILTKNECRERRERRMYLRKLKADKDSNLTLPEPVSHLKVEALDKKTVRAIRNREAALKSRREAKARLTKLQEQNRSERDHVRVLREQNCGLRAELERLASELIHMTFLPPQTVPDTPRSRRTFLAELLGAT